MELNRRKFVSTTGAAVASLAVAGCMGNEDTGENGGNGGNGGDDGNGGNGNDTDDPSVNVDDQWDLDGEVGETPEYLEITSFSAYETSDNVGVMGTVENVGNSPLDDIEIEVTLNDGDTVLGEFVDTSTEVIDSLSPGESWQFNVVFEGENLGDATDFTVSAQAEVVEDGGDEMNDAA